MRLQSVFISVDELWRTCESARGWLKSWHPAENVEKRGTVSAITGSFKMRGSLCFVPLPLISLYLAAFAASANRLCSL